MKIITAVLAAVLLAVTAQAQQSKPTPQQPTTDRADMADQQACYQQAQVVVEADRKGEEGFIVVFMGSHYDAATKTCYVEYSSTQINTSQNYSYILRTVTVKDAFEGKTIASFVGSSTQDSGTKGGYVDQPPTECHVNGKKCDSRPIFNGMLWKFIPAFRPVNAKQEGK